MKYFSENISGNLHDVTIWMNKYHPEGEIVAVHSVNGHTSVVIWRGEEKIKINQDVEPPLNKLMGELNHFFAAPSPIDVARYVYDNIELWATEKKAYVKKCTAYQKIKND